MFRSPALLAPLAIAVLLPLPRPCASGQTTETVNLPLGGGPSSGPLVPASSELRVFDPSLIDKSIDPCDNFYRYSCNGWFKRNPLPPDQVAYGRFTELYELNRLHLKQILEGRCEARIPRAPPTSKRLATSTPVAWTRRQSTSKALTPLQARTRSHRRPQIIGRTAGAACASAHHRRKCILRFRAPTRISPTPTR